jgi:microcystin-dependent protein
MVVATVDPPELSVVGACPTTYDPASSGTALTVEEKDGTPSYTSVAKIQFDQDDGFSISEPVSGTVLVNFTSPDGTQTGGVQWVKYDVDYADFATAGVESFFKIDDLAPGGFVEAMAIHHTQSFSGGSISYYELELYINGNAWGNTRQVNSAPSDGVTYNYNSPYAYIFSYGSAVDLEVRATSSGDDLDAATQGQATFYLKINNILEAVTAGGGGGGSGTVTSIGYIEPGAGLTISGTNPVTSSGVWTFALADDLAALEGLTGTNTIYYRSADSTWTAVTVGTGLSFSSGTLTATGGSGTVTSVGITAPAAGISVSGSPVTTSGNMTLALANDLAALEALSGTDTIYYRSGADTWSAVTIGSGLTFIGGTLDAISSVSVSDGDKGDITVSSGGTVWTIDNDAVTYAKMQNVSTTSRVLGRRTAGAGDVEECTLTQVLDMVGSVATCDILYRGASDWTRLAAGTNGYVLTTRGTGSAPEWARAIPAGSIQMFGGTLGSIPSGWLLCDGSAVSRTTYADLFAVVGTTWGAGNGSTTFNVPDLQGRAPIGVGTGSGLTARTLGQTGGSETHTLVESEMPAHTHNVFYDGDSGGVAYPQLNFGTDPPGAFVTSSSTGGGAAHNNMQPWAAVYFIIKT